MTLRNSGAHETEGLIPRIRMIGKLLQKQAKRAGEKDLKGSVT